jgi:hypothetical protein
MPDDKGKKKEEKMTPEEKLFRVIAAGGRDFVDFNEDEQAPAQASRLKFLKPVNEAVGKMLKKMKDLTPGAAKIFEEVGDVLHLPKPALNPKWSKSLPPVSLKTLNKGFVALAGILMLYLVGDILFGNARAGGAPGFNDLRSQAVQIYPAFPQENIRPVSYYLTPVTNRNVFLPPGVKGVLPGAEGEDSGLADNPAPEGYKLVGISWDDQGFVAMIEAPEEQGARFVRKGDTLPNGVKVKEVKNYSVLLSSGNQKWELS